MILIRWAAVAGYLALSSCTPPTPPTPPTYSPNWVDVAGDCGNAKVTLEKFACPEANPRGTTWEKFCAQAQASEGAIALNVGCIERAVSVEGVRACYVRCRK